jgi:uncharacterized protein involved in type VI secretion and phage assembly
MTDNLLNELAEHVRTRFYGKYRGVVTDVDEKTMRIKASVPAVLPGATSGWALPCVPYAGDRVGFFFLPAVGSMVWIEFEGGDVSYPIWSGCFWEAGQVPPDASATTRGVVTSAPHKLLFDDKASSVTIADSNAGSVVLDSNGVAAKRGSGNVLVADSGVSVNDDAFKVQ